jgi:hypothetical protein
MSKSEAGSKGSGMHDLPAPLHNQLDAEYSARSGGLQV